jgi:hypothetical protein
MLPLGCFLNLEHAKGYFSELGRKKKGRVKERAAEKKERWNVSIFSIFRTQHNNDRTTLIL